MTIKLDRAPYDAAVEKGYRMRQTTGGYLMAFNPSTGRHIKYANLLAETVYGEPIEPLIVDHIDRDRSNDSLENLRVCTIGENTLNSAYLEGRGYQQTGYVGVCTHTVKGWSGFQAHVKDKDSDGAIVRANFYHKDRDLVAIWREVKLMEGWNPQSFRNYPGLDLKTGEDAFQTMWKGYRPGRRESEVVDMVETSLWLREQKREPFWNSPALITLKTPQEVADAIRAS